MSVGSRPLQLAAARRVADAFAAAISVGAHRIEVKGSIAREVAVVNDIEIVAIPRIENRPAGGQGALFEQPVERVSLLWEVIDDLVDDGRVVPLKPGGELYRGPRPPGLEVCEVSNAQWAEVDGRWAQKRIKGARYLKLWLPKPRVTLDLFLATQETWGAIATIRTGSRDFSRALVSSWKRSGSRCWCWDPSQRRAMRRHVDGCRRFENRLVWEGRTVIPTPEERDVFDACGFRWVEPPRRKTGAELERQAAAPAELALA